MQYFESVLRMNVSHAFFTETLCFGCHSCYLRLPLPIYEQGGHIKLEIKKKKKKKSVSCTDLSFGSQNFEEKLQVGQSCCFAFVVSFLFFFTLCLQRYNNT